MVGVVVGRIVPHSPSLVYCLYTDGKQDFRTNIIRFSRCDDPRQIVRILHLTLGPKVVSTVVNTNNPSWYYVQLEARYPPHKIPYWDLPITVYFERWETYEPG